MTDLFPVGLAGDLDVAGLFLNQTAALAAAFAPFLPECADQYKEDACDDEGLSDSPSLGQDLA